MSKRNLFIVLVLLLVAVIIGSSILLSRNTKQQLSLSLIQQFYSHEELIAQQTASTLKNYVTGIIDKLRIIAQLPEIKAGDMAECNAKIEELLRLTQLKVGNLGRVNKDGVFVCSANKSLIGLQASKLGDYIPKIFNDPKHEPVISRAFIPPGVTSYISAVHVPVMDSKGQFIGTLGGAIYFNELEEKILKDIKPSEKGAVVLIDDDGTILYHPSKEIIGKNVESDEIQALNEHAHTFKNILNQAINGKTGTVRYVFNGVEKIAAFAPVKVLPDHIWMVVITVPLQDVNENISRLGIERSFNAKMGFEIAIIILTASVFLWYMMVEFFNPINKISNAAKEVAKGNWEISVPVVRNDEIGTLAKVFNEMTQKLRSYYSNLETEVKRNKDELAEKMADVKRVSDQLSGTNAELASKVGELEKMNAFMIDRELKMIELKKENDALKNL